MKILLSGIIILLMTGCSLFGEQYRDRSFDYLTYQPAQPIKVPVELSEQASWQLVSRERFSVEPSRRSGEVSTSAADFTVPKPSALMIDDTASEAPVSVVSYEGRNLNPRLAVDGSGSRLLQLDAEFALAWSMITEAISQLPYPLTDLDRSIGTFFMQTSKINSEESKGFFARLFKRDAKEVAMQFLIRVDRSQQGVYVSVLSDSESFADESLTSAVLTQLKDILDS